MRDAAEYFKTEQAKTNAAAEKNARALAANEADSRANKITLSTYRKQKQ